MVNKSFIETLFSRLEEAGKQIVINNPKNVVIQHHKDAKDDEVFYEDEKGGKMKSADEPEDKASKTPVDKAEVKGKTVSKDKSAENKFKKPALGKSTGKDKEPADPGDHPPAEAPYEDDTFVPGTKMDDDQSAPRADLLGKKDGPPTTPKKDSKNSKNTKGDTGTVDKKSKSSTSAKKPVAPKGNPSDAAMPYEDEAADGAPPAEEAPTDLASLSNDPSMDIPPPLPTTNPVGAPALPEIDPTTAPAPPMLNPAAPYYEDQPPAAAATAMPAPPMAPPAAMAAAPMTPPAAPAMPPAAPMAQAQAPMAPPMGMPPAPMPGAMPGMPVAGAPQMGGQMMPGMPAPGMGAPGMVPGMPMGMGGPAPYEDEMGMGGAPPMGGPPGAAPGGIPGDPMGGAVETGETIGNSAEETSSPPVPKDDLARIENLKIIHSKLLDVRTILKNETDPKFDSVKTKLNDSLQYFGHIIQNLDSYVDDIDDLIIKYKKFTFVLVQDIAKTKKSAKTNEMKNNNKNTNKKSEPKKIGQPNNKVVDRVKMNEKDNTKPKEKASNPFGTVPSKKNRKELKNKSKFNKE